MGFIVTLILTTLAIAGSAAFFSIYGLGQIFTGSFWPVVVMATSLEAGKLVGASFLYRYWGKLTHRMKWLRNYMAAGVFVLMVITSAGIFGFLSAAYQQDILPLEQKEQQIELLVNEKSEVETLKGERLERRRQIDADIASLPNNYITGRQRLMESYGPELNQIRADIKEYTDRTREITLEIQGLKAETLEQRVHTGPIVYIAKVFETDVDEATKWLILIIIFAFDPFAVALTIGANMAILDRRGESSVIFEAEEPAIVVQQGMTADDIEKILNDRFSAEKKLSPDQLLQKSILEETLAKKRITEKIRKGS